MISRLPSLAAFRTIVARRSENDGRMMTTPYLVVGA
jgi:hypothetical protein